MPSIRQARALRRNATDAEQRLWRHLRRRGVGAAKFRRQQVIGPYVVDFINFEARVIVEVDGGQHARASAMERARTTFFEDQGFRVLRFWNNEVLENIEGVLSCIQAALRRSD